VGAASVLEDLREQVQRTVAEVIEPGTKCALLGYPNHTNPGDHGVWLGAKATLERRQAEIVYECSWRDYSRDALATAVEEGAQIVFTGGGNFGDLWPATHALRERVLADFVGTRVVQLQQSVHFEHADNLARTADLLRRHGNVTLMVRDRPSLELAERCFDADVRLAPDLAFATPLPAPTEAPRTDVAWIARQDRESRGLNPEFAPRGVWRIDWNLRDNEQQRLSGEPQLPAALNPLVARNKTLTKAGGDWRTLAEIREQLTELRLKRGCWILGRGRVIVTDSLHAHVLGLMLGIPSIATDNSYGKLRATFEAFTHAVPLARWADTPSQALAMAAHPSVVG
jgi:exopolysaccharide biosynthesis predicted pyruvyltransferase EpsI